MVQTHDARALMSALPITRKSFLRAGALGILTLASGRALADKPIKLGMLVPSYDQFRWKNADGAFFLKEGNALGARCLLQASNMSESLQANQVENMLTLGIDALVLTPVNADAASALVHRAKAAGVPVVDYNFLINNADCDVYVGRDAIDIGEQIATAATAVAPKGNYILCFGDEGTSVAVNTAKGNLNVLKPYVDKGDIKIVSQQYNKAWSGELSRAQVENALTRANNDIAAVICSNDGMAYGAIQALQAQGLAGKVFVAGVDCEPHAQELIRQGLLSVSNFSAFNVMGVAAAKAAVDLVNKRPIKTDGVANNGFKNVPWIKAPSFNITKANIEENVKERGWWFKAP
jgi:D-xylose transport system substrate-binding protein